MSSPRAVAEVSDVVFCMPSGPEASRAITTGPDGILAGLRPNTVVIDLSTNDPVLVEGHEALVRGQGAIFYAAPVSGTPLMAQSGELTVLVGGPAAEMPSLESLLGTFARSIIHVGSPVQAAVIKLAINISIAGQVLAFSEGVILSDKAGIPRATMVRAFVESAVASPMLRQRAPYILDLPIEPMADVKQIDKDLSLALDTGRRMGAVMPLAALARELAGSAIALGHGDDDLISLFVPLALLAGVPRHRAVGVARNRGF